MGELLRRRALMEDTKSGRLPTGFVELDYIESDGTQIIVTSVIPHNTRTKFEFMPISRIGYRDNYFVGCWGSRSNQRYYAAYFNSDALFRFVTKRNEVIWIGQNFDSLKNSWHSVDYNNSQHEVWFDGVKRGTSNGFVLENTNTEPLKLFSLGNANQTSCGRLRLLVFEDNDSGIVIGNYIPCKRIADGAVGMYDLVSQNLYVSNVGNPFTAGPVI